MLAASIALALHVALFAALGQRRLRLPTGSAVDAPAIELDEAAAGDAPSPAPSRADASPQDMADETASVSAAKAVPETQPAEQPEPLPTTKSDVPEAVVPPRAIAAPRPKSPAKKPPVRRAVADNAPDKPAASVGARRRARVGLRAAGGGASAMGAGTTGSSPSVGDWNSLVSAQIRRNQRYPDSARSRGEEGVATVFFSVARSGAIGTARLAASSGYPDLDAEALAAVRRSNPLPPPPTALGAPVTRNVPIRFGLR